jgi:Na+/proline symporter
MNAYEVSSGMAMPYAAFAVMGKGGVVAILLMVFMAVTSAMYAHFFFLYSSPPLFFQ